MPITFGDNILFNIASFVILFYYQHFEDVNHMKYILIYSFLLNLNDHKFT